MDHLTITNLVYTYYNKKTKEVNLALDNISLEIPLGKTTAIIGKIGSGKTTLIKIIGGILPYDSGDLYYKGKNLDKIYVEDRNFSYISQTISLNDKKTVFDNLCMPLLSTKMKKDDIRELIYKVAHDFKIDYLLTRKPRELSIGQIQMVNLAKSVLKNPELFLLDEPFSNLDLKTSTKLRSILKNIISKNNSTCIIATHNINDVLYLADYIVVLDEGTLVEYGKKEIIYCSNNEITRGLLHAEDLKDEGKV